MPGRFLVVSGGRAVGVYPSDMDLGDAAPFSLQPEPRARCGTHLWLIGRWLRNSGPNVTSALCPAKVYEERRTKLSRHQASVLGAPRKSTTVSN